MLQRKRKKSAKKVAKKLHQVSGWKSATYAKVGEISQKFLPKTFGSWRKSLYLCTRKSEMTPTALTNKQGWAKKTDKRTIFDKNYIKLFVEKYKRQMSILKKNTRVKKSLVNSL